MKKVRVPRRTQVRLNHNLGYWFGVVGKGRVVQYVLGPVVVVRVAVG